MARPGQGAVLEREQTRAGTDGGQLLQIMALAALSVGAAAPHNAIPSHSGSCAL